MTQRKPYEVPRLIRVTLNPTQAVLTQCSTTSSAISRNVNTACDDIAGGHNCRRDNAGHGQDSAAHS